MVDCKTEIATVPEDVHRRVGCVFDIPALHRRAYGSVTDVVDGLKMSLVRG